MHSLNLEIKELPPAPNWRKALGVGVVVMGLTVGTGELILWPHIVTKYGLSLLWLAFLGLTFQYFINQEVGRLTLATGESFFTVSARFFKWLTPFWLFTAAVLYIWPGWAGAMGTILRELFGFSNYLYWALASLMLVLILTFSGRVAYRLLEKSLKIIVPIFFVLLVTATFLNFKTVEWSSIWKSFFDFKSALKEVDLRTLFGAIIFAGAGGLLNLCVSLWYRDKGVGMGQYVGRITNPITGKTEAVAPTGFIFEPNEENMKRWRRWLKFIKIDQGVIFWFLGLISLFLLSFNAFIILRPKNLIPEGTQVAVVQAHIFGEYWGQWGFDLFLIMAFLMLFVVMWTVIDAFTRIVSDVLYVNARIGPWQKYLRWVKKFSIHHLYYGLILILILVNAVLLNFRQPLVLLIISAVLGGLTMAVYTPILIYINNKKLAKPLRPSWFTNLMLGLASVFYISFSVYIVFFNG